MENITHCLMCGEVIQECPSFEDSSERYCNCQNDCSVDFNPELWGEK